MSLDTSFYYQLSNASLGAGKALEVIPDGSGRLRMSPTKNITGQAWKLVERGGGQYALRTQYLGEGLSLNVLRNASKDRPVLATTGDFPGQAWTLTLGAEGTYKLTNDLTGPDRFLDTTCDTDEPILTSGDHDGQIWTLTQIRKVESNVDIPPLDPKGNTRGEGPTDFKLYARPEGVVRAVMIFVDFEDAPAAGASTADVGRHLLGNGSAQRLFRDQSYQRMVLDVTVKSDLGWRRMPRPFGEYETHVSFEQHKEYISQAVCLFAADVELSDYAMVFIATPGAADLKGASSFRAQVGNGIPTRDGEIRLVTTFDGSSLKERYTTLVHEVGHLFGLPDLYRAGLHSGHSRAGGWDLMSDSHHATSFLGWHRHKNGWLDLSRKTYVADPMIEWSGTLHPLADPTGLSMVVFPVDDPVKPSKVFVLELAQQVVGDDGAYWGEGVLLYVVDATVPSGSSPVVVVPNVCSASDNFGNLFEAPYGVGDQGSRAEGKALLVLEVLERFGDSYTVTVRYERR
ncbi:MAG TPA: hypothetical protein VF789_05570 [Thermoanaerobaculia bacterium]